MREPQPLDRARPHDLARLEQVAHRVGELDHDLGRQLVVAEVEVGHGRRIVDRLGDREPALLAELVARDAQRVERRRAVAHRVREPHAELLADEAVGERDDLQVAERGDRVDDRLARAHAERAAVQPELLDRAVVLERARKVERDRVVELERAELQVEHRLVVRERGRLRGAREHARMMFLCHTGCRLGDAAPHTHTHTHWAGVGREQNRTRAATRHREQLVRRQRAARELKRGDAAVRAQRVAERDADVACVAALVARLAEPVVRECEPRDVRVLEQHVGEVLEHGRPEPVRARAERRERVVLEQRERERAARLRRELVAVEVERGDRVVLL